MWSTGDVGIAFLASVRLWFRGEDHVRDGVRVVSCLEALGRTHLVCPATTLDLREAGTCVLCALFCSSLLFSSSLFCSLLCSHVCMYAYVLCCMLAILQRLVRTSLHT